MKSIFLPNGQNYLLLFLPSFHYEGKINLAEYLDKKIITFYATLVIWNDDVEYTSRILKKEFGVLCPNSIVYHKTKEKYTPIESSGNRFYYEVRNKIWMIRTDSFYRKEKIKFLLKTILNIYKYIKKNRCSISSIKIVSKGIYHGVIKKNP